MHFKIGVISKTGSLQEIAELLSQYDANNIQTEADILDYKDDFIRKTKARYSKRFSSEAYEHFSRMREYEYTDLDVAIFETFKNPKGVDSISDEDLLQFVIKYDNYNETDFDAEGNYVIYVNTNSEFDGWTIGGRYKDTVRTKSNKLVTSAKLADVDFRTSEQELKIRKLEWEHYVNNQPMEDKVLKQFKRENPEDLLEDFETVENYIEKSSFDVPTSFISPEGEWYYGSTAWQDEQLAIDNDFLGCLNEMIADYPDYIYTVIDCHT